MGRHKGSRLLVVGLIMSLLLSLAGCSKPSGQGGNPVPDPGAAQKPSPTGSTRGTPEKTKVVLGTPVPAFVFLPVFVAREQGFFKEEGLDVEILQFKGDAEVLQALAGGSVDMTLASLTGLLAAIDSGQKFKTFWAGYNMPIFEWYGQPKYKSIAETKGGRYGVTTFGALTDILTRYALKKAGLDPEKDVKVLQLGGTPARMAALDAGQLDATILTHPGNYQAAEKGYKKLFSQKDDISKEWPTEVFYAKQQFLDQNPNTVKAFLRANAKAIAYIQANVREASLIGVKEFKFSEVHSEKATAEFRDGWFADGRLPSEGTMKLFWEISLASGEIKQEMATDKWFDDRFFKTYSDWGK